MMNMMMEELRFYGNEKHLDECNNMIEKERKLKDLSTVFYLISCAFSIPSIILYIKKKDRKTANVLTVVSMVFTLVGMATHACSCVEKEKIRTQSMTDVLNRLDDATHPTFVRK